MSRRGETDVEALLRALEKSAPRPMTIQQLVRALELESFDRKQLKQTLEGQVATRRLRRVGKSRYLWVDEAARAAADPVKKKRSAGRAKPVAGRGARVEGRFARVRAGFGFVEVLGKNADDFPRDILIPRGNEGAALHGDRVEVEIVRRDPRLRRVVGRVVGVPGPVHQRIIGTLRRSHRGWCLVPESELLPVVEITGRERPRESDAGLVALVQLTSPAAPGRAPTGELERVLGNSNDPEVQFLAIAYEHGLRMEFGEDVIEEVGNLPADPVAGDFAAREDLRTLPFVTIDGESARDFDDAVCLEERSGGTRLRVAIADVSHYVKPGSAIDGEAASRGTSVYFPDRAIPMLPPELSNTLCSLNPGRDRLVLVAEMDYDTAGRRQRSRFYRGVIRSSARLTYARVASALSGDETPAGRGVREELGELLPQLELMCGLMRTLYEKRVRAGSLDLDLPEALVDLSEEGRSVGVRLLQRNDAHRMIEEFMLEANQAVAIWLRQKRIAFPYRIHEPPDPADIDEVNHFLRHFGFQIEYGEQVEPADLQTLLGQLAGHRLSRVLSRQILRSLTRAQYSTNNSGHFGLAFPIYCHFTSPIRRYPDLLVHRQLGRVLDDQTEEAAAQSEGMEAACIASSQAEREAMEAERAMLDLKKAEFMLEHLLEPEPGTVVSVLSFGIFVELDRYPIEGLVRVDDLTDDLYRFVEEERALIGRRRTIRLGQRVLVETTNVSLHRRQIDLALLKFLKD
jgi:ribonuclease R